MLQSILWEPRRGTWCYPQALFVPFSPACHAPVQRGAPARQAVEGSLFAESLARRGHPRGGLATERLSRQATSFRSRRALSNVFGPWIGGAVGRPAAGGWCGASVRSKSRPGGCPSRGAQGRGTGPGMLGSWSECTRHGVCIYLGTKAGSGACYLGSSAFTGSVAVLAPSITCAPALYYGEAKCAYREWLRSYWESTPGWMQWCGLRRAWRGRRCGRRIVKSPEGDQKRLICASAPGSAGLFDAAGGSLRAC